MKNLFNKIICHKEVLIKSLLLIVLCISCINRARHALSYPTGDGAEYVLVTEAFYRHQSPNITYKDCQLFKKSFIKVLPWDSAYKPFVFDALQGFIEKPNKQFNENFGGLYVSESGKIFGYHFFSYSLTNVPVRYILGVLKKNPLSAFKITNAALILLTCCIILFFTPFNTLLTCLIAISFYFSSTYWYIEWIHTEVFTVCMVTISLWLFFQKKYYIGLLAMSIAASQNQPLVLMVALLAIVTLFKQGFNIKTILKTGLSCVICLIPVLFYYYHFHTFSIIKDAGFLDTEYQTPTRILGFYFDINQGVVLAIPCVLFIYIVLWCRKVFLNIKLRQIPSWDQLIVFVLIAITFTISTMINWNHGQTVVNRYATWMSAIILIHFFFFSEDLKKNSKIILFSLTAVSQTLTTLYHQSITKLEVGWEHKPIADWVLSNHPSWYNPDPTIFGTRTSMAFVLAPDVSPITYFNDKKELCKIMCHIDKLGELSAFHISKEEISNFRKTKKPINGWVYINRGEFKTTLNNEELFKIGTYLRAKKAVIPKIKVNPPWYKHVQDNAKAMHISEDSSLVIDALYVMQLEEDNKKK